MSSAECIEKVKRNATIDFPSRNRYYSFSTLLPPTDADAAPNDHCHPRDAVCSPAGFRRVRGGGRDCHDTASF
jgi:hypothetical protein